MSAAITHQLPKHWFGTIKFLSCSCNNQSRSQVSASCSHSRRPHFFYLVVPPSPKSLESFPFSQWVRKDSKEPRSCGPTELQGKVWTQERRHCKGFSGAALMHYLWFFSKWLSVNILNKWTPSLLEIDGLSVLISNGCADFPYFSKGRQMKELYSWISDLDSLDTEKARLFPGQSENSSFWGESHNKGKGKRSKLLEPSGSHGESSFTNLNITEMFKIGKQSDKYVC